ncbi:hypothetical protein M1247_34265 [Mycobacterium sp. 21AC1]|uniref:hypothetical protein n=1 Tax=[Mycobacterium] appelbergii TaxID=2939269 RepID=UPI0029392A06|nr:hypothetical protein [Mycobacterium sp. 21AC1]MDV3130011.1 hypothetical protein [Mycobacterium sp. 21AC1]
MTDDTTTQLDADPDGLDGSAAADDLSDLSEDDYATAAEIIAQEATPTQDDTSDAAPDLDARDQKYRQRLRAAEAENDRLHGLVEAMQADEIHRLAAGKLADPADLLRDGATVADLLDDDGHVDPARVDGAINEVLQGHPHWAAPAAPYRGPLLSGATSIQFDRPTKKFAEAFAPPTSE